MSVGAVRDTMPVTAAADCPTFTVDDCLTGL